MQHDLTTSLIHRDIPSPEGIQFFLDTSDLRTLRSARRNGRRIAAQARKNGSEHHAMFCDALVRRIDSGIAARCGEPG